MRKLADIRGADAMDLVADIASIGNKVMSSPAMKRKIKKGTSFGNDFAADFLQILLKDYQDDCITMLAECEGVSRDQYLETASPRKISDDIGQLMQDSLFNELFFALAQTRANTSGSASASTPAQDQ